MRSMRSQWPTLVSFSAIQSAGAGTGAPCDISQVDGSEAALSVQLDQLDSTRNEVYTATVLYSHRSLGRRAGCTRSLSSCGDKSNSRGDSIQRSRRQFWLAS